MSLIYNPAGSLLVLVGLGLFGLKVWALVDCATRPSAAFEVHHKLTKTAWLVILILAVLLSGASPLSIFNLAGAVAAIVYLVDVRPAVGGLR